MVTLGEPAVRQVVTLFAVDHVDDLVRFDVVLHRILPAADKDIFVVHESDHDLDLAIRQDDVRDEHGA